MSDLFEQKQANNLDELKVQLENLCESNEISKFDSDDIFELIEDGEEVDWILEQLELTSEEAKLKFTIVLGQIKEIVHPEAAEFLEAPPEGAEEEPAAEMEVGEEEGFPTDFSQMGLPEGMKLPPGMNMEKLQKMLETPQGSFMADFSVFCQEKGVMPTGTDKESMKAVQQLQEEWMDTPREAFDGKTPRQMTEENPELAMPGKVETYRREQPKVGRNDPCPCGSGKKYKKCCGRGL